MVITSELEKSATHTGVVIGVLSFGRRDARGGEGRSRDAAGRDGGRGAHGYGPVRDDGRNVGERDGRGEGEGGGELASERASERALFVVRTWGGSPLCRLWTACPP